MTDAGTMLLHSSFSMRAGNCLSGMKTAWGCSGPLQGLIWTLGALCLWLFAYNKIPGSTRWIRPEGLHPWSWIRQPVTRSLKGAYKLHAPQSSRRTAPMNLDQALRVCFLPAVLSLLLLSGTVSVLSCGAIQATQGSRYLPTHSECPQLIVHGMWELLEAVHTTCVATLPGIKLSCLSRAAQVTQAVKEHCRAFWHHMVERLSGSSSGEHEYTDMMNASDSSSAPGEAAGAAGATIYDRLGQVVREPPGPPPNFHATAEADVRVEEATDEDEGHDAEAEEARVPTWDCGPIAQRVAQAVGDALNLNGPALAHVPGDWRRIHGVVITLHAMRPHEQLHPGVVSCGNHALRTAQEAEAEDQELQQLAADHEGLVDGPLFGLTSNPDLSERLPRAGRVGPGSSPPVPDPARSSHETRARSSRMPATANNKCGTQLAQTDSSTKGPYFRPKHSSSHPQCYCSGAAEMSDPLNERGCLTLLIRIPFPTAANRWRHPAWTLCQTVAPKRAVEDGIIPAAPYPKLLVLMKMTGALHTAAKCYIFLASTLFTLRMARYGMPTSLRLWPAALHIQTVEIALPVTIFVVLTRLNQPQMLLTVKAQTRPGLDTQTDLQHHRCPSRVSGHLSACTYLTDAHTGAHHDGALHVLLRLSSLADTTQAQHQPKVPDIADAMTDATGSETAMAAATPNDSQPGSPQSLLSEGPLPPPDILRDPPRGPPPARRMQPEHEVSLRISGAVANALYSSGHSQLRRIVTILPEGWQLMPGLLLTARRLTPTDRDHPGFSGACR